MNKAILYAVSALAIAAASPALAQNSSSGADTTTTSGSSSGSDTSGMSGSQSAGSVEPMEVSSPQEFVNMAAMSNMFEIQSSKLALEKSKSDEVQQFAQKMIDDHTMAAQKLEKAASADQVAEIPSKLDDKHQQMIDKLNGLDGEEFTQQYLQMQLQGHQQAVALFKGYKGKSGALGEFASATLPTLQEHLDMVTKLAGQS